MELKLRSVTRLGSNSCSFNRTLNGIEIRKRPFGVGTTEGFNRTLNGIEMHTLAVFLCQPSIVLIVP